MMQNMTAAIDQPCELTAAEVDQVSGGFVVAAEVAMAAGIAVGFVVGAAIGAGVALALK